MQAESIPARGVALTNSARPMLEPLKHKITAKYDLSYFKSVSYLYFAKAKNKNISPKAKQRRNVLRMRRSLLVAEGFHWVNGSSPAGWDERGGGCGSYEQERYAAEDERIAGAFRDPFCGELAERDAEQKAHG